MTNHSESLDPHQHITAICNQFEQLWLAGESPQIEDFLQQQSAPDGSRLLSELLEIELRFRRKRGETPTLADYSTRFPDETEIIESALSALLDGAAPSAETVDASINPAGDTSPPDNPALESTFVPDSDSHLGSRSTGGPGDRWFGDYELLHEIARGGMGVVFKARQTQLNRIVALKMIKSGELASQQEVQRFHTEAEAAAQLDHPNIVPIYEVGEKNGLHFFSMGFVRGKGLDSELRDGPLPPHKASELIQTIAEAIQYAHDKGIVHRDLKPSNVLIDSDGKPRITDFGLAKNITGDSNVTATGQVMGTPSYMPPEQALGKTREVGPLADVYSLGAMLYALLTGRPPFQAANVVETLRQVSEQDPVSPRVLNPAVDQDLETICLKCLEKDVEERYRSADELASDLARFLHGEPITARPIGRIERGWRWCRRNRTLAGVAGIAILLLLTLAVGGPLMAFRQSQLRQVAYDNFCEADRQRGRADAKVLELEQANQKLDTALAETTSERNRANRNLKRADEVVKQFVTKIARVDGPLAKYPATQELRKQLLNMARDYYEKLISENPDANLSLQSCEANIDLAMLVRDLSGDMKASEELYRQALQTAEEMSQREPDSLEWSYLLGKCHNQLAIVQMESGRADEALISFRQSLAIRQKIAEKHPIVFESNAESMATVHENIAQLHRKRGRADVALKEDLQALKILEQLTKANPTKIENQTRRIGSLLKVADDFKRLGQFADAVEHAKQGLKACEDLTRTNKSSAKIQLALADSYQSLADVYYAAGNSDHRLPALEKALVIREQLAASNPLSNKYRADLAHCYGLLMIYFQQRRKWQEAIPYGEKGIRLWEELASENPKVVRYKDLRAFILKALVGVYFGMNDDDQAIETAQKALEANRELVRTNPNVPKYRHEVASTLAILAVPMVWKQPDKALDLLNEARRIFEHLRGKHLSETEFLSAVQGIHHRSAIAYENQGDFASAADAWKAALDATEQSGDRSTFSYFLRQDYHGNYGLALAKSGQHRKADQELAKFLLRLRGESIQHRVLSRNCSEFFIIVRGLATCLAAAKQDTTLSKSEEQRLMARYLSGAMVMLGALRETGYFQAEEMRIQLGNMPELYPLHHSHVFQGFAQSLGVNLPAWAQKP